VLQCGRKIQLVFRGIGFGCRFSSEEQIEIAMTLDDIDDLEEPIPITEEDDVTSEGKTTDVRH
jgi:hypothetical protein